MNIQVLNARADAGIALCVAKFGKARVMRIKPESIDQNSSRNCLFAQAAKKDYLSAVHEHGITEDQELKFGFLGNFNVAFVDRETNALVTTDEMTDIVRERLEFYQAKQREPAAVKHRFAFLDLLRTFRPAPKFTRPA